MEHQNVMSNVWCERGVHGTPKGDVLCLVCVWGGGGGGGGVHGTPKCDVQCLV